MSVPKFVSPTARRKDRAQRPRIVSRSLWLLFASTIGAETSFYLLLTAVPLYATSSAGRIGAGLTTAALTFSTVAAEFVTPRLVAKFGYRLVFAAGLLLLGVPALALISTTSILVILAICVVRGLGFGLVVVVGSALVASLVPDERRGEGLGIYGVVVGVPAIVGLPLGVWLVGHAGYHFVFVAGAALAIGGLVAVPGFPGREPGPEEAVGILAGLRTFSLVRPAITFSATAMAAGVVVTFLPLAVTRTSGNLAALALLAQATTATLTRWWAGRYGDRHDSAGPLLFGVLAVAVGILALVLIGNSLAVLLGMMLFGAGFGVTQNASLALMFDQVSASGYGTASALWNLAYDGGLGSGAALFGLVVAQTGYPLAFGLTAALMFAALAPAWHGRTSARRTDLELSG
jgi:predicted MFS family arabinose efflux permease